MISKWMTNIDTLNGNGYESFVTLGSWKELGILMSSEDTYKVGAVSPDTGTDDVDDPDSALKYVKLPDFAGDSTTWTSSKARLSDSSQSSPALICSRWRIKRCIGKGSFGQIYLAQDIHTDEQVAVKMEPKSTKLPQLLHEARIYRSLQGQRGFTRLRGTGEDESQRMIVLDLLGPSLEDLFDLCSRKFSNKTVLSLAIQVVSRLEQIHKKGVCHRDIKPDNFLIGLDSDSELIFLIDFGLSKQFLDPKTGQHIGEREKRISDLVGTARYCSIRSHQGLQLGRKDDLESAAYLFVYFAAPGLPWQGLRAGNTKEKYEKIGWLKMNTSPTEICKGLLPCYATFLEYTRQLKFQDEPDYDYCRGLFQSAMKERGYVDDQIWDWTSILAKGVLTIGVIEGRNLAGKKAGGLSDPYCTIWVTCNGTKKKERTCCIQQDLNPRWDSIFEFPITDSNAKVGIYVWSKTGTLLPDRFLGRISFSVASLTDKVVSDCWQPLQKRSPKSRVSGDLHLRLFYRKGLSPCSPSSH